MQRISVIALVPASLLYCSKEGNDPEIKMLFGVVLGLTSFFHTRDDKNAVIDDFPFR